MRCREGSASKKGEKLNEMVREGNPQWTRMAVGITGWGYWKHRQRRLTRESYAKCSGLKYANDGSFEGVDTDSNNGTSHEPVSYPASVVSAASHCLKAASAESRSLCISYKPVSRPKNTSFISYKCLSPFSSNMLRVTTFPASWGSCPLHTVITHSIKAVSKPSFSASFP